ncbi:MAG TPA: hypothetical protein VLA12_22185 [Planctomycetaceae bacterium]|nr:hypothetical protein [Planctomycetaceae bacterium]
MTNQALPGWCWLWTRFAGLVLAGALCASASAQPLPLPEDPHVELLPEERLSFPLAEESIRVEPYGSLRGNMYYSSSRTNPGSFTVWVFSDETQGEAQFEIDVRRSRIGAHILGPEIELGLEEYSSSGRVEIDFLGQFLTENRASPRLRHVYWELQSESHRFLVGQTDDVISPLLIGMLNFTLGRGGGNIGFRRAQFRAEQTIPLEGDTKLLLQESLNQDIIDDFPAEPGIRRETANWPVIEGRAAILFPAPGDAERTATIGLSGHVGETGFDFLAAGPPPLNLPPQDDVRLKTWSINLDAEIPLSPALTLRGELFRGANLSPFFGGIGQGVCPCLRVPIHSEGGWIELAMQLSPRLESHIGFGIDDPEDEDSLLGRVQNSFVFGNLILQVTDELSTGVEIAFWRTLYHDRRVGMIPAALITPRTPGEAITLDWMVRYDF